MANTRVLTVDVENFVRSELKRTYGEPFTKQRLPLGGGKGLHEFDAVSNDRSIVASVKSSSGMTSGNKNPSGKISSAIAEMYFLSLVDSSTRLLVLTNPDFFAIMIKTMKDRMGHSIEIVYTALPDNLMKLASRTHTNASIEISTLGTSQKDGSQALK